MEDFFHSCIKIDYRMDGARDLLLNLSFYMRFVRFFYLIHLCWFLIFFKEKDLPSMQLLEIAINFQKLSHNISTLMVFMIRTLNIISNSLQNLEYLLIFI